MKNYNFIGPKKNKGIYIFINTIIIVFNILILILYKDLINLAISIAVLFLFNGLWSINRKWYSFIHRDNKSYYCMYAWLMAIIIGILLTILIIIYIVL